MYKVRVTSTLEDVEKEKIRHVVLIKLNYFTCMKSMHHQAGWTSQYKSFSQIFLWIGGKKLLVVLQHLAAFPLDAIRCSEMFPYKYELWNEEKTRPNSESMVSNEPQEI